VTVVIKGQKCWLELAGSVTALECAGCRALLAQFPEVTVSTRVLESGLNNPNCIGHVPAYIGGAVTLDRDVGDGTMGVLHFDEARLDIPPRLFVDWRPHPAKRPQCRRRPEPAIRHRLTPSAHGA
jgi:hypothetical protein